MATGTEKRRVGNWIESGYLGRGTFGMVMLWYNEVTKEKIALKTCRNDPPMNEKNQDRWRQEVEFLKWIKHPNIIETCELPVELRQGECNEGSLPALCMEYCEGGDLRKTLSTAENCCGLKETMIIRICVDIASAIKCLHNENIAHRDLKPENIVICPRANQNTYKVIDLGYAKQADQSGMCYSLVGTHYYLAPEILNGQKYTPKVDLWSYGILLYECCTGVRPFPKQFKEIYQSIHSKELDFIAVTFEEDDTVVYQKELPEVNRLNCVLKKKFEELFHLLLDVNPSRRGLRKTDTGNTRSWKDCVDEIENTQIIEVFCIELYRQFAYELTSNFSLLDLQRCLEKDTGIPCDHQELFIADGSNLTSLSSTNQCLTAFMCNKRFDPNLEFPNKPEIPRSLCKMLEDSEDFSKRSMKRHLEVYQHSVFFINKQIISNKCLIRGLTALVIRLLKWSREEFSVKSNAVSQQVTELSSVVSFFEQSLDTDLKYFDTEGSTYKNGLSKEFPDFEAWRRVKNEMDTSNILSEAKEIFKTKAFLQNEIATMKNNKRFTRTREISKMQLAKWVQEIHSRYDQMKTSCREDKSSSWKSKIGVGRNTIKNILENIENFNKEFYDFFRELFILRQKSENFIQILNNLLTKAMGVRRKITKWQQSRQEQIWQLLSSSKNQEEQYEKSRTSSQSKSEVTSRRRTSAAEIVKQSQVLVSRVEDTLKDVKHKQEIFKSKMEDLDWSFCDITDAEDANENSKDT